MPGGTVPASSGPTIAESLLQTRLTLASAGDEHPGVSAEWLVGWVAGMGRAELYAHGDEPLGLAERFKLMAATAKRAAGEPLQYITGSAPFRGIEVACAPGALIPRPETELLVELALAEAPTPSRVLEVGCGTGCVACSIASEAPGSEVWATDIAPEAVDLARRNAEALGLSCAVHVVEGDLADGVPVELLGTFDLLISNPPYVPSAVVDGLPAEVIDHEPRLALDGGGDGLSVIRRIVEAAPALLAPGGVLALELFEGHAEAARELAEAHGDAAPLLEAARIERDLADRPRYLIARRAR